MNISIISDIKSVLLHKSIKHLKKQKQKQKKKNFLIHFDQTLAKIVYIHIIAFVGRATFLLLMILSLIDFTVPECKAFFYWLLLDQFNINV